MKFKKETSCRAVLLLFALVFFVFCLTHLLQLTNIITVNNFYGISTGKNIKSGICFGSVLLPVNEGDYIAHYLDGRLAIHKLINTTNNSKYVFTSYGCRSYYKYAVGKEAIRYRTLCLILYETDNCSEVLNMEKQKFGLKYEIVETGMR